MTVVRMQEIEAMIDELQEYISSVRNDVQNTQDSESISVYKEALCYWMITHAIPASELCEAIYHCTVPETDNSYDTYEEVLGANGLSTGDVWDFDITPSEISECLKLDEDIDEDNEVRVCPVHFIDLDKDYYRLCEIIT